MKVNFKFEPGQKITIIASGDGCEITHCAIGKDGEHKYAIAGLTSPYKGWFTEEELKEVE